MLLTDLKAHLRYFANDQDTLIMDLQSTAVDRIEADTRRQLKTATWRLYLDRFFDVVEIRKPPVQSIEVIRYRDMEGNLLTLNSNLYRLFAPREPAEVRLHPGLAWPSTQGVEQAVEIDFVCGYSDGVPARFIHAIKLIVEDLFLGSDKNEVTIQRLLDCWGM